jgi:hypothetical protein
MMFKMGLTPDLLPKGSFTSSIGGTIATIEEIYCKPYIGGKGRLPAKRPYEGEIGDKREKVLAAGESTVQLFALESPLDGTSVNSLKYGLMRFYVLGWILYRDGLGIKRMTHFCRRYDTPTERFEPVEDTEYESED